MNIFSSGHWHVWTTLVSGQQVWTGPKFLRRLTDIHELTGGISNVDIHAKAKWPWKFATSFHWQKKNDHKNFERQFTDRRKITMEIFPTFFPTSIFRQKQLNDRGSLQHHFTDRRKWPWKFRQGFLFQLRYLGQSKMTMKICNVISLTGEE